MMNKRQPQRLSPSQLTETDRLRRKRRNAVAKAVQGMMGQSWVMRGMLHAQLGLREGASTEVAGFALHPAWAQECWGHKLVVHVAVERIRHYLADWLEVGGRRIHTSDFFLAYGAGIEQVKYDIERLNVLKEARELMAANWDFQRTDAYAQMVHAIGQQRSVMRQQVKLDTLEKVEAYFLRFHALYKSVIDHGLLSNRDVVSELGQAPDREIGIALGRDGGLVKLHGGQHRFALAVAQGMKTIPVELRMVHADVVASACRAHQCSAVEAVEILARNLRH